MSVNSELTVNISSSHRLQWEESQQKDVILYPEGLVELNQSSAEILKLCDGSRTPGQIVSVLEERYSVSDLSKDINNFLGIAIQNGWIKQP